MFYILRSLIVVSLIFMIGGCSHNTSNQNTFHIEGFYEGDHSQYIILRHTDAAHNWMEDTLRILNGQFSYKGRIDNIAQASLRLEHMPKEPIESLPLNLIFIEQGKTTVEIKENEFDKLRIQGGQLQNEFKSLEAQYHNLYEQLNDIVIEREPLSKKLLSGVTDSITLTEVQKIEDRRIQLLDSIKQLRLRYAMNNPESNLSAYFLLHYNKGLTDNFIQTAYNKMNHDVKNGVFGSQLKLILDKRKPQELGDKFPDFIATSIKGHPFNIAAIKSRYVLIDFWASWCKPCKANIPLLKDIYRSYDSEVLSIVSISIDENRESWIRAIKNDGTHNWFNIIDSGHAREDKVQSIFKINSIPLYILLDDERNIILRENNLENLKRELGFII